MNPVTSVEERVMFSPSMPGQVNTLLQAAVAASSVDQGRAEIKLRLGFSRGSD